MWADGDNAIGGWLSIPATLSAEVMARAGFDYVCVDTQHGAVEYQIAVELIRAIEHGGSIPIVRVPWNEPGIIGKMLDAGAEGVIIPMVNTPEEAEAAVRRAVTPQTVVPDRSGRPSVASADPTMSSGLATTSPSSR